jgi:riboflavin kinase / FMN adenylyltransferase
MQIIQHLEDYDNQGRGVFCTIGMFDGLHLGHRHVIQNTIIEARKAGGVSLGITFDQHPAKVVAPQHAPEMIYPLSKRKKLLASTDLDIAWVIPFTTQFSQITGQSFLENICTRFRPLRRICVGPDFHFGHNRSGNIQLLRKEASRLDFELPEIKPVRDSESEISSTVIRTLIRNGKLEEVKRKLGRPYEICGTVIQGKKIGRSIGFPTANLDSTDLVLPPNGVYAVRVNLIGEQIEGVMNIGIRPTVDSAPSQRIVEVHFFDFDEQIYDHSIEIQPIGQIRPEIKFPSIEDLKRQIESDCLKAKKMLRAANDDSAQKDRKILNPQGKKFVG